VPSWLVSSLQLFSHVKVIVMHAMAEDHSAKLWRFRAFSEPDVELVLVRDVDSRLNARDAASVDDFVRSGFDFHVTADHVAHQNFLITACCFAGWTRLLSNMYGGGGGGDDGGGGVDDDDDVADDDYESDD